MKHAYIEYDSSRINKGFPSAAIDEAILKISNIEGGTLEQCNETFNNYKAATSPWRLLALQRWQR